MRVVCAVVALFAFVFAADAALADDWRDLGSVDSVGLAVELNVSSIQADGPLLLSWVRFRFKAMQAKDEESPLPYQMILARRADDCAKHAGAILANIHYSGLDDGARVVARQEFSRSQWEFHDILPDTVEAMIHQQVCALPPAVASRPNLRAANRIGPTAGGAWRMLSSAPDRTADEWIDADEIVQLAPDLVVFPTRRAEHTLATLPTGESFKITVTTFVIDCRLGQIAEGASDYYDADNVLVSTSGPPSRDQFRPVPIQPGTVFDLARSIACAPGAARPTQDAAANPPPAPDQPAAPAAPDAPADRDSVGTGWLAPKGYVVTAFHVIKDAESIVLAQNGAPVGTAEVAVVDPANDVAILRPTLKGGPHVAIPLREGPAPLGLHVFTLGYPAPEQMGLMLKMTSGEISALAGLDVASSRLDDVRLMQVSMPIHTGNSGGPVIDDTGHAAGIVISKLEATSETEVAQNVSYALKIGYVKSLLADLPDLGGWRAPRRTSGVVGEVSELQGGVFLIIAQPAAAQPAPTPTPTPAK